MENLLILLRPDNLGLWWAKIVGLYLASYLVVWLGALLLSRLPFPRQASPILRTYLAWSVMLTLHAVASVALSFVVVQVYRTANVPLWYGAALLIVPVFLDGLLVSAELTHKIRERSNQEERRLLGGEKKT